MVVDLHNLPDVPFYEGDNWHSSLLVELLSGIQEEFSFSEGVVVEIDKRGCCNLEGYASNEAILASHLQHGLRLPFYCLLRDLLELLGLALANFIPLL